MPDPNDTSNWTLVAIATVCLVLVTILIGYAMTIVYGEGGIL